MNDSEPYELELTPDRLDYVTRMHEGGASSTAPSSSRSRTSFKRST